jgi:FAD/FMN-containing dehydrogenase
MKQGVQKPSIPSQMLASELEEIVGEAHISTKETDKLIYSTDWFWVPQMFLDRGEAITTPDYIVRPGSAEEISKILKLASAYRVPVIPWGGGSGSQGGALPIYGGIILDTKRLDQIIDIDEVSLTVTAQAGINGAQLEWALNEKGLTLPHYPASANCATLGGYLAPRGSGTLSTKYGKAEDLVLGMEVVLPSARGRTRFLPPVPRVRRDFRRDYRSDHATRLSPRNTPLSGRVVRRPAQRHRSEPPHHDAAARSRRDPSLRPKIHRFAHQAHLGARSRRGLYGSRLRRRP